MTDYIRVDFYVNDEQVRAEVPSDLFLMDYLRNWMRLTGTKNGCAKGHCGSCTVLIDGEARRSCLIKMSRIQGKHVETIEGLAKDGQLHPLQYTFIKHGAIQCGFCTPGMIMTAKSLLDKNPTPSEKDIKEALTKGRNLCRCTGYVNIIKAVKAAAEMIRNNQSPPPLKVIKGEIIENTLLSQEGIDIVTGVRQYADDITMEGMLYGRVLWSDHPHAEIIKIDTKEAENLHGVEIVLTSKDIPGLNQAGLLIRDQPAIAEDKVRYIGDPVAVVFAESPEVAEQALKLIQVKYNILPGVFTPEDAAKPDGPKIHEKGNLAKHLKIVRGDVNEAFERCEVIVEEEYSTPWIEQGFLEPESGLAYPSPDGGVVLKIGTMHSFGDREQLSEILGIPEEKVRVVQLPTGGAFGAKEDLLLHQHLALGAYLTGKPVKMVLTREESMRVHEKRHPAWMHYKVGANQDGHIMAIEACITIDTGAYMSNGHKVLMNMVEFGAGPYYIPNLNLEGYAWHTNNVIGGAMRGFGVNQVAFALEVQIDEIARLLNMGPFEIRRINALDVSLPTAANHVMEEGLVSIKQTIDAAEQTYKELRIPDSSSKKKIGVGIASAFKSVGFGREANESAGAVVEIDKDGNVLVKHSQHDFGQGANAALLRLAVEELGLPLEKIQIVGPDTALTPSTGATTASRQTFLTGNATIMACRALKDELFNRASEVLDQDPDNLSIRQDRIWDMDSESELELEKVIGESYSVEKRYTAEPTTPFPDGELPQYGDASFKSRQSQWCYTFCTQVAVVEVDTDTGEVRVIKIISANDLGKVLNRPAVEGQIHGSVVQGIGYALTEKFNIEDGINLTKTLHQYRMPTADQAPEIIPVLLEIPFPDGPHGAKGFAESPILPTAPAILNAVYDAVGVRIRDLPADRYKILGAMKKVR